MRRAKSIRECNVTLLSQILDIQLREDEAYRSVNGCTLAQALREAIDSIGTVKRGIYWPSFLARYKRILTLLFGLEDRKYRTFEEVGREFSLTRERIRQIKAKALRLLRHPSRSRKLKTYIKAAVLTKLSEENG